MKKKDNYKVYIHTTPNNKVYIGITKQSLNLRWNYGHGYETQLFGRAIRKYGWENIKHEVLFDHLSETEAKAKEIELISQYDSTNPKNGYNCTMGGDGTSGFSFSAEQRAEMKNRMMIKWQDPNYRNQRLEHLKKLNTSRRGKKMPLEVVRKSAISRGRSVNRYTLDGELTKQYLTMMDAAKDCGAKDCSLIVACCKKNPKHRTAYNSIWKYADEPLTNEDILWSNDINKKTWKPVAQYDLDGNLIDVFESVHDAERNTGISFKHISQVCYNHRVAKGFLWRYPDEELLEKIEPHKKPGRPVVQLSKEGKFIARFNHAVDAGKQLGIQPSHISAVCNGSKYRKSAGGFIWRFEDSYNITNGDN